MEKYKNYLLHNGKEYWAIVDEDGKVIQKFRTKGCAVQSLPYYQESHIFKLKVIFIG